MTNECIIVYETEIPLQCTVADGAGIEKGAILSLADLHTGAMATGDADYVLGIAAQEKIASDGRTKLAYWQGGIFKGVAGGTVTAGKSIMTYNGTGADNTLIDATNAGVAAKTVGTSLETASVGETFLFILKPGVNTNVLA